MAPPRASIDTTYWLVLGWPAKDAVIALPANQALVVIGQFDDVDGGHWYAIEAGNGMAFVPAASVVLQ